MTISGLTEKDRVESWLREFDEVCQTELGMSFRDLPDQNLKAWYQNGMTPKVACFQMMQNLDAAEVYFQESDVFSDADSGI